MADDGYRFIIGLDLGQSQDYTALCVVERVMSPPVPSERAESGYGDYEGWPAPDTRKASYHVRHLERPPLGTKYPVVVAHVKEMLATPPLSAKTPLVIDKTGVGTAVADMFTAAGMSPWAVTITGGDEVIRDGRHTKVPKRELVGNLVMLFQSGRLKIADGLAEGPVLVNELVNFKVKVNLATGHDSYEAWRESVHDDLVLAVALACWHGEHTTSRYVTFFRG
ncbi:MAG: hypothetical protein M3Y58_17790 [Chloroflexota bacterium]|nr:hypothetical protein [Chloroflexota bacterium]